jgi:hypothetical protein
MPDCLMGDRIFRIQLRVHHTHSAYYRFYSNNTKGDPGEENIIKSS